MHCSTGSNPTPLLESPERWLGIPRDPALRLGLRLVGLMARLRGAKIGMDRALLDVACLEGYVLTRTRQSKDRPDLILGKPLPPVSASSQLSSMTRCATRCNGSTLFDV